MEEKDTIDLRKYVAMARKKWYLYAASFVVFLALAITYHCYHMEQYTTYASILIEEDSESGGAASAAKMSGGMASIMRSFSIGGLGSSSVDNELLIFQSHNILVNTIKDFNLNFTYIERDGIKKVNLYKKSPVMFTCPAEVLDTLSVGMKFKVNLHKGGKVDIVAQKGFFKKTVGECLDATLPCSITTPYGTFQVLKTAEYSADVDRSLNVILTGTDALAQDLSKLIEIDYSSKKGDGVGLVFKAADKQYGKDLLNGMMSVYNRIRLTRKNEKAMQSLEFYDKMIEEITSSLTESEQKMQDFQTKNDIVSPEAEATYFFGTDKQSENEIIHLRDQITMYNLVLSILSDSNKKYELLPSSSDDASAAIVTKYNELILNKRNIERSATPDNIMLKQLTSQIDAMRGLVSDNVSLMKKNTENVIQSLKGIKTTSKSKLSKTPYYQREYINLMRDKELKNDLYVFLLQKRYNSAMTLASNFPSGFVIEPAYCDIKPLMTKSLIGFGACMFLALLCPTVLVCMLANRKSSDEELVDEEAAE